MTEEKKPDTRVRVEFWKNGELVDTTEGKAIIGTVIVDGGQNLIAQGRMGTLDIMEAPRGLVRAYLSCAAGRDMLSVAKVMLFAELMNHEEGEGE